MINKYLWKFKCCYDILQSANILLNYSNNCKTWWNTCHIFWMWIDYTISITIKKFDLYDFTTKNGQVFHSNEHKCVEKKHFVKKLLSFERWQELCWRLLYQNPFYMFLKMLNEIKEKMPKLYPPKSTFYCLKRPPCNVFSPMVVILTLLFNKCLSLEYIYIYSYCIHISFINYTLEYVDITLVNYGPWQRIKFGGMRIQINHLLLV
jgi:hypothetical protein